MLSAGREGLCLSDGAGLCCVRESAVFSEGNDFAN